MGPADRATCEFRYENTIDFRALQPLTECQNV